MPRTHDEMGNRWPLWRLLFHLLFLRHEITNWDDNYPPPVCRDCEMLRLQAGKTKGE